ncbi:MAG: hypothetical protein ABI609_02660 [Acidobacteriota bacterium]
MPPEASSIASAKSSPRWPNLALGLFFLALYAVFYFYLPRLPGEFSYIPSEDPLPFAAMRGFTFEQMLLHVGRMGLLGPALLFIGLGLAGWIPALHLDEARLKRWARVAAALSLMLSAVVLTRVLHGGAIVDDENTYRDQAMMLADGHLAETRVPPIGWEPFTIESRIGLVGKYLFGEPLVQVPGVLVGLPGLLHIAFGALALLAWFVVVRGDAGVAVASWATILLALSPMFAFTNGTGLSHSTAFACVLLAGLGLSWIRSPETRFQWLGALLAGQALGFGFAVRPQVILPVGGVLGLVIVWTLARERSFGPLAAFLIGGGVWAVLVGLYDRLLTGSVFTLPWDLFSPRERFGFVAGHTPWRGLENLAVSLVRFNGWWLGLPLGLAVVAVWFALGRPSAGLRLWAWCGLALVAFNFCYRSPGVSDTGPVYYFELLLPASLLAAHVVVEALRRWPAVATSLLLVHLVAGTGTFVFEQARRLGRLHEAIHGQLDSVLANLEQPALLIHEKLKAETTSAGWVFGFPVRLRSERDPVVTYPRNSPEEVKAVRTLWSGRHCYYYRLEPVHRVPQVFDCEAAEDLLARPLDAPHQGAGYMPRATATVLGYFEEPGAPR